jgi:tryptophan-rich sensory protein
LALLLYGTQLALNFAWTPLFFGFHYLGAAAMDAVLLLGTTILTAFEFGKINETAGLLMVPYIGWVTYASLLSLWIWRNNSKKE